MWLSELEILDSSIAIVESSTTESWTLRSLLCDLSLPTAVPAAILDKISKKLPCGENNNRNNN